MTNDTNYSLLILVGFLAAISLKRFSSGILELLLFLTRPGATILLLSLVAYVYSRGLVYTSLALALVTVYLLKDIWTVWVNSDQRRLEIDIGKDLTRFDPRTSVDLQWARKSVQHDSPNMLYKSSDASPLLVYPPSNETLRSMSG